MDYDVIVVGAGAQFHDGEPVRAVEVGERRVTVRTDKGHYAARALAGADGANGMVGQSTGAAPRVDFLVGNGEATGLAGGRLGHRRPQEPISFALREAQEGSGTARTE